MATAAAAKDPLEEHITCSICLEIYDKPYSLKCLHTFCYRCLMGLQHEHQIQCPSCRKITDVKHIQSEFKVQGMVDLYHKLGQSPGETEAIPHVVETVDENAESWCEESSDDGDQWIDVQILYSDVRGKMVQEMQTLLHKSFELGIALENNCLFMDKIQQTKAEAIAQVNKERQEIKTRIDTHHDGLIHEIKDFCDKQARTLQANKQAMTKIRENKEAMRSNLSDISKCASLELLTYTLTCIQDESKLLMSNMHSHIQSDQKSGESTLTVHKGMEWDPSRFTKVKVLKATKTPKQIPVVVSNTKQAPVQKTPKNLPTNTGSSATNSKTKGKVKILKQHTAETWAHCPKVIHKAYKQVKQKNTQSPLRKMCYFRKEIWCAAGKSGIVVYSLQCEQVNCIRNKILLDVTALVKTPVGDIVSDKVSGLFFFKDSNYDKTKASKIDDPGFADVAVVGEWLFAVQCLRAKVYIYNYKGNIWVKQKEIPLMYDTTSWSDTISANESRFFVCSNANGHIYVHRFDGSFLHFTSAFPKIPTAFETPFICDMDREGRQLLISDSGNNRIMAANVLEHQYRQVITIENPVCAVMSNTHIWVATQSPTGVHKLCQYKQKKK